MACRDLKILRACQECNNASKTTQYLSENELFKFELNCLYLLVDINTLLCPIIFNSNTIELTMHTSCYCLELTVLFGYLSSSILYFPFLSCVIFNYHQTSKKTEFISDIALGRSFYKKLGLSTALSFVVICFFFFFLILMCIQKPRRASIRNVKQQLQGCYNVNFD